MRARERLILAYSPLVKYVAGRVSSGLPAHIEHADLVSYGIEGLIGAVDRYDPDREVKFETYAVTRIRGAILDELRGLDWVPRSVRANARKLERANAKLESKLGRTPSDAELAKELGISEENLQDWLLDVSNSQVLALDEMWTVTDSSGDQVSLIDTIEDPQAVDPQEAIADSELKQRLADAIVGLPERERVVVTLYYYEELTLREIGEILGVTESRVSQIHTKALLTLRSRLKPEGEEPEGEESD